MFRLNKTIALFFFFFLFLVILHFSPSFFSLYEVDSSSYIFGERIRKSIYPALISVIEINNLIILQKILLTLSLASLVYLLILKKHKLLFIIFFSILCSLNIYYTSFSKTILTESLFFSFINFSIFLFLIDYQSRYKFFLLGLFCGIITSLKSIGFIIGGGLLFLTFIKIIIENKNKYKKIFFLIFSFSFFPLIEGYFYFKKFNDRSSVIYRSLIAKTFMISGTDRFDYKKYPIEYHNLLVKSSDVFKEVQNFLSKIKNPILKADISADYEVVGQYQVFSKEMNKILKLNNIDWKELSYDIGIVTIREYPIEFIRMSLWHYIGLWTVGGKIIFLDSFANQNNIKIPLKEEIIKSSGDIKIKNKKLLFFATILFSFIGIIFMFVSLYFSYKFIFLKRKKENFDLFGLVLLTHSYFLIVAMTNVATPRYLMPMLPLILILIMKFFDKIFKRKLI